MYKGITPTFILTLPEEINLGDASHVYVTFSDRHGRALVRKQDAALSVEDNTCGVYLSQEETLRLPSGRVQVQLNWTYDEGDTVKRAASDIVEIYMNTNLEGGVLA